MPPSWKPRSTLGARRFSTTSGKLRYSMLVEVEVDAGQQERVAIPARRAPHPQRNPAERRRRQRLRRVGADRDHLAAGVDDEVGRVRWSSAGRAPSPAGARASAAGCRRSTGRQLAADRQQPLLVVDHHRHAERQRREALALALRDAAQRRVLDQHRQVAHLQRAEVERLHAAPAAGRAAPLRRRPR